MGKLFSEKLFPESFCRKRIKIIRAWSICLLQTLPFAGTAFCRHCLMQAVCSCIFSLSRAVACCCFLHCSMPLISHRPKPPSAKAYVSCHQQWRKLCWSIFCLDHLATELAQETLQHAQVENMEYVKTDRKNCEANSFFQVAI